MCSSINKRSTYLLESFQKPRTLRTILGTELLPHFVACKQKQNTKIFVQWFPASSNKSKSCYPSSNDMLSDHHLLHCKLWTSVLPLVNCFTFLVIASDIHVSRYTTFNCSCIYILVNPVAYKNQVMLRTSQDTYTGNGSSISTVKYFSL